MVFYRAGDEARHGGADCTISLWPDEAAALGWDARTVCDLVERVLRGVVGLRVASPDRVPPGELLEVTTELLELVRGIRDAAIRAHAEQGGTYRQAAMAMGVPASTGQRRREAVTRRDPSPGELWATGRYAPVDHPGVPVPPGLRDWSVRYPGYLPVDITPPELRPGEGLRRSVAEGWAEPYPDPRDVPLEEMRRRQQEALIRFELDNEGRPLNPTGRTGRCGRNLGRWGENTAADTAVVAGDGADRQVLLIRRADRGVWGLPGRHVDPSENAIRAAARELAEEAGVRVDELGVAPEVVTRECVDDWRNTDHAWVATTVVLWRVPQPVTSAAEAGWFPFSSLADLDQATGGQLYDAHRPLLEQVLKRL